MGVAPPSRAWSLVLWVVVAVYYGGLAEAVQTSKFQILVRWLVLLDGCMAMKTQKTSVPGYGLVCVLVSLTIYVALAIHTYIHE